MSISAQLSFNLYRISDWANRNPNAMRLVTIGLALTAALAALLLKQDITWACPNGGGQCGS